MDYLNLQSELQLTEYYKKKKKQADCLEFQDFCDFVLC
jgi:hypothetical protein